MALSCLIEGKKIWISNFRSSFAINQWMYVCECEQYLSFWFRFFQYGTQGHFAKKSIKTKEKRSTRVSDTHSCARTLIEPLLFIYSLLFYYFIKYFFLSIALIVLTLLRLKNRYFCVAVSVTLIPIDGIISSSIVFTRSLFRSLTHRSRSLVCERILCSFSFRRVLPSG